MRPFTVDPHLDRAGILCFEARPPGGDIRQRTPHKPLGRQTL
jgi:hypothetical protein